MSAEHWTPDEAFAHAFAHMSTPPGEVDSWRKDEAGDSYRCFTAWQRVLISESSGHCPYCGPVFVRIVRMQSSSGHKGAGILLDSESELNSVEARKLAAVLMDAADELEDVKRRVDG